MSITSEISRYQYLCDNSQTEFSFNSLFFRNEDLKVILATQNPTTETLLTLGTHYTVTGANNPEGGTVTTIGLASLFPTRKFITIYREVAPTQMTVYAEGADFPALSHERALDKLTMIAQQQSSRSDRSLQFPITFDPVAEVTPGPNAVFTTDANSQPKIMTHAEFLTYLSLSGGGSIVIGQPTVTFADAGERALAVPAFAGQVGIQRDTKAIYLSNGTTEGDWTPYYPEAINVLYFGAVGDGVTEDGVAILAAVATGKPVCFPAGYTFLMNGETIIPSAGQRFFGGGTLKKTTLDNDLTPVGIQDAPKFFQIHDVDNVLIENITIIYTGSVSPRLYGMTIQNAAHTIVRNCKFEGQVTSCFIWKNSTFTQYVGNTTRGGNFGVATGGDGEGNTDGPVYDTLISGNILTGSLSEGVDINWDTVRCVVSDNLISGNGLGGGNDECIDIGGGVCSDIFIINNTLDGNGLSFSGVTVKRDTLRVLIEGNTIFNGMTATQAFSSGVSVGDGMVTGYNTSSIKIVNNFISGYQGRGVIFRGIGTLDDILISGNTITCMDLSTSSRGIDCGLGSLNGVIICNNRVTTSGATFAAVGIFVATGQRVIIRDNLVKGFGAEGIVCTATRGATISGNHLTLNATGMTVSSPNSTISGNHVYANTARGIVLSGGVAVSINGNIVKNNSSGSVGALEGIRIAAGCDRLSLVGNLVTDDQGTPSQRGINFSGASDRVMIMANTFYNNSSYNIQNTGSLTNSVYSTDENIVS